MRIPFLKNKQVDLPSSHTWEHVATTQYKDELTSLLFLNELGEFQTINLQGTTEQPLDFYIKSLKETGTQSLTFYRDERKYLLAEFPETKLPIKNVQSAPVQQGAGSPVPAQTMATKS